MAKTKDERLSLDEIIHAVNKKMGESVLLKGSQAVEEIPRLTTGILAYDLMLGGGWPVNQWSEIVGMESSGKTALAYKTIAANMAMNPEFEALWVAAEEFVPSYAKAIGVDLDRLWLLETNVMEIVFDTILQVLDNRAVDMIVLDSLPALVPDDEAARAMEEFTVGLGARLTGKFFRKSGKAQKRSLVLDDDDRPCTMIVINQWREKIGVMYGETRTTPGGLAKNFHFFVRVEVKRDEIIKHKDHPVGQTIKARTLKNKTYRPNQVAVADFYYAKAPGFSFGEWDHIKDLVNYALTAELIGRKGSYYSYEDQRWQGREAMLAGFREDVDLQKRLKEQVWTEHFGAES